MLSFRQKIYLSYLVVFLVFLVFLFPFANQVVRGIVRKTLIDRTSQIIASVVTAPDEAALIRRLEDRAPYVFFRVSLLKPDGSILYDSHVQETKATDAPEVYLEEHPEITEALKQRVGTSDAFSYALGQRLMYIAKAFTFQGAKYVMRTSYPLNQITELTDDFEMGFLLLGGAVLILFSLMISIIAIHLSRPIQTIIRAIKPYEEGRLMQMPRIELGRLVSRKDDFQRLASTLNSLTAHIEQQIKTLEHEKNEKMAVLESLVEGVVAVDCEMVIVDVNQKALEMLGQDREAMLHHPFTTSLQPTLHDILVRCQQQEELVTTTAELGERKRLYVEAFAVPRGKNEGAILILHDQSIHYRTLEMRKDFIANASHELKTPLTIVRGFAEAIHDHPDMSPEMLLEVSEKIITSSERMERLVKNLLRLADVENLPRQNLQSCDLKALCESCRKVALVSYPEAQIDINQTGDVTILADPDLLELAIVNLLDNGAKYSEGAAKINVELSYLSETDDVKIIISDHGIGIPKEDLDSIFLRFYTVDKAHSRRLGGSGLGLSIFHTIIEKHFGTVEVDSVLAPAPNHGTTFMIVLPVNLERYH